jgi:hypothetical protein
MSRFNNFGELSQLYFGGGEQILFLLQLDPLARLSALTKLIITKIVVFIRK